MSDLFKQACDMTRGTALDLGVVVLPSSELIEARREIHRLKDRIYDLETQLQENGYDLDATKDRLNEISRRRL